METWNNVVVFIQETEWAQGVIIFIMVEVLRRFFPSRSKESLTEMVGKGLRIILDKIHVPNNVKKIAPDGEKVVVDANPKNDTL